MYKDMINPAKKYSVTIIRSSSGYSFLDDIGADETYIEDDSIIQGSDLLELIEKDLKESNWDYIDYDINEIAIYYEDEPGEYNDQTRYMFK